MNVKKKKTSDEQQKPKVVEETVIVSSESESESKSSSKKPNTPPLFMPSRLGVVTLILATMGIVISIDSLLKVKEWRLRLQTFKGQMQEHLTSEQQRLNSLESALQNIGARQQVMDKELSSYHATLSAIKPLLVKNIQGEAAIDVLWQLQKAYDRLEEASLDLSWSSDGQSALLLLQSADRLIDQLQIKDLVSVHESLAQSINALSKVRPLDEKVLLEKIKSMSNQVLSLPMPANVTKATSSASTEPQSAPKTGWRGVVNRGFEWIQQIVVVKPVNSVTPLPQSEARRILNENLLIALQQMQWALLQKDSLLYHWSIEQLLGMTHNNGDLIDLQSPQAVQFIQGLDFLEQQNLAPPVLPNIQPAVQQLKAYIEKIKANIPVQVAKE